MPNGHTTPTPPPAFAPPVPSQFAAHFADAHGREAIVIHNDGHWLRTTIRGVALAGHSLDDFEPVDTPSAADLAQLTLSPQGQLCACELRFDLPLPLTPPCCQFFSNACFTGSHIPSSKGNWRTSMM